MLIIGGAAAAWTAMTQSQLKQDALVAEREANEEREKAEKARQMEEEQRVLAVSAQQRETVLRREAEGREQVMRTMLYGAEMNLAAQAIEETSGVRRVAELLERWKPSSATPQSAVQNTSSIREGTEAAPLGTAEQEHPPMQDLRGWEWYYLNAQCHRDLLTVKHQWVATVAWSPDGKSFSSGSKTDTIEIRDADTGQLKRTLHAPGSYLNSIVYSPDGKRLAAGGGDQQVRIWDVDTGEVLLVFNQHTSRVTDVKWSPDGTLIASAATRLIVWDPQSGTALRSSSDFDTESDVAWSPDGTRILAGNRMFDSATLDELATIETLTYCCGFSPDGAMFAVQNGKDVVLYATSNMAPLRTLHGHKGAVNSLQWNHSGTHLATGARDDTIRIWDIATGQSDELRGHTNWVLDVCWSPDDRYLASAGDSQVKIWDVAERRNSFEIASPLSGSHTLAWNPDTTSLAAVGTSGLVLYAADSGQQLQSLDERRAGAWSQWEPLVCWSASDQLIAAARGNQIQLFDDQSLEDRHSAVLPPGIEIRSIAISPDGKHLSASYWQSADESRQEHGVVALFELSTGKHQRDFMVDSNAVGSLTWSPDGTRIATAGWQQGVVIDATTGDIRCRFGRDEVQWINSLSWSPEDGRLAAGCDNRTVEIFDVNTGEHLQTLQGHTDSIRCVRWHNEGTRIASSSNDRTVRIWDGITGALLFWFNIPEGTVEGLAWSPDGMNLGYLTGNGHVGLCSAAGGYRQAGSPKALEFLNRYLADHPEDHRGQLVRRSMLRQLGRHAEASTALDEQLQRIDAEFHRASDDPVVQSQLAELLIERLKTMGQAEAEPHSSTESNVPAGSSGWKTLLADAVNSDELLPRRLRLAGALLLIGRASEAQPLLGASDDDNSELYSGMQKMLSVCLCHEVGQNDAALAACGDLNSSIVPRGLQELGRVVLIEIGGRTSAEGEQWVRNGVWKSELAEVDRLVERHPNDERVFQHRGYVRSQMGRWSDAATDLRRFVEFEPSDRLRWSHCASLLLMANDREGFRQLCEQMRDQLGPPASAEFADTLCKVSLMLSDAVDVAELPVPVLREGEDSPRWAGYHNWFRGSLALVAYRKGEWKEAVAWTDKLSDSTGQPGALALVVQAMALYQQGDEEAALKTLQQAEAEIPVPLRTLGTDEFTGELPVHPGSVSPDWLFAETLRREASTLIRGSVDPKPTSNSGN